MRRFVGVACAYAVVLCCLALVGCEKKDQCGNGRIDQGESCDGSNLGTASCQSLGFVSGTLGCTDQCLFDVTECVGLVSCGDGIVDPGEQCDGSDLAGQTCESRSLGGGTLACDPITCQFDVSGCEGGGICGDGVADGDEECDGEDLRNQTCADVDPTYLGGTLSCSPTCSLRTTGCYAQSDYPIGDPCTTSGDCGSQEGAQCYPEVGTGGFGSRFSGAPGGFCYERCDDGGGCPLSGEAGVCVSSGYFGLCFPRCEPAAPSCRDGYECVAYGDRGYCSPHCTDDDQCVVTHNCELDPTSDRANLCVMPTEVCTGGVDEDLDGLVDCADPDCNDSPSCPSGEICDNQTDDDSDGLIDCDDGECAVLGICTGALCSPVAGAEISCDTFLSGETNDASGSTQVISTYSCLSPDDADPNSLTNEGGPEYTYTLTVPSPRLVTVNVSNLTNNVDLVVAKQTDGDTCDPWASCFAYSRRYQNQPESVTFAAYPDQVYYVIVDGRTGVVASYNLAVTCDATTTVEDCGNASDDDGDGLNDCDDPECMFVAPDCNN